MGFSPDFLDEIRARHSLAEVIGRKVRLTKRGREYVAVCPFHNEKTPSFTVSEEKGFFHCFGCGAHGDVIGFVMRFDNLSFPEAVERLATDADDIAMGFSPDFLDEIRARHSLAEVIGRKVRLTKRGREYVAVCPFHNEKTPSFTVSEEKGFFHCFGCGAHGDVIGFVMRFDNLSFPEAPLSLPGERECERRMTK